MKLSDIAELLKGDITGKIDIEIRSAAKIEDARSGDITFLANLKYKKYLRSTEASAILLARDLMVDEIQQRSSPISIVRVTDPYQSFLRLIDVFYPAPDPLPIGIHPTAVISESAVIGKDAAIGAHVVVGDRCSIASGAELYPGTVLHNDVHVGLSSLLYANVTVREQCRIGDRVIVHSGTVIGSDGFGFAPKSDKSYEKIPQRGIVVIEDDVEIGANCTIDRATIGETIIRRGAKLDNLIHVAHNVIIGEHTVIAAQSGISGSTKVGSYCALGGQAGLTGHITIADNVTIGAQSGVPKSITEPGKTYFGYPAREIHETWRIEGAVRQLPALIYEIRNMQQRIEELERELKSRSSE